MSNPFTFFGEVVNSNGHKTHRSGKIITFTGGFDTSAGWGASTATTLEEITSNKVVWHIRTSGKLVLALPLGSNLGNRFAFQAGAVIPRFSINIQDTGRTVKSIFFQGMTVERIVRRPRENVIFGGVEHRFETFSTEFVYMNVDRHSVTVS